MQAFHIKTIAFQVLEHALYPIPVAIAFHGQSRSERADEPQKFYLPLAGPVWLQDIVVRVAFQLKLLPHQFAYLVIG